MHCSLIFSTTYYCTIYITSLEWQTELLSVLHHQQSLISTQKRLYHHKSKAFKLNPNFLAFFFFCFLSFEPRIYVCMYAWIHVRLYACMYVCVYVCIYVSTAILNLVVSYLLNISIFPSTLCYLHWSNWWWWWWWW